MYDRLLDLSISKNKAYHHTIIDLDQLPKSKTLRPDLCCCLYQALQCARRKHNNKLQHTALHLTQYTFLREQVLIIQFVQITVSLSQVRDLRFILTIHNVVVLSCTGSAHYWTLWVLLSSKNHYLFGHVFSWHKHRKPIKTMPTWMHRNPSVYKTVKLTSAILFLFSFQVYGALTVCWHLQIWSLEGNHYWTPLRVQNQCEMEPKFTLLFCKHIQSPLPQDPITLWSGSRVANSTFHSLMYTGVPTY